MLACSKATHLYDYLPYLCTVCHACTLFAPPTDSLPQLRSWLDCLACLQEWASSNKVPMLHREVKPHAAVNTATLYKTEDETAAAAAPTNILQVRPLGSLLSCQLATSVVKD